MRKVFFQKKTRAASATPDQKWQQDTKVPTHKSVTVCTDNGEKRR